MIRVILFRVQEETDLFENAKRSLAATTVKNVLQKCFSSKSQIKLRREWVTDISAINFSRNEIHAKNLRRSYVYSSSY